MPIQTTANKKPHLGVIVGSTRPGRMGKTIADWFVEVAQTDGRFEVELIDLAEVNLPFMDEPHHPRLRQYTQEHTKMWSERIDACDAFVFVTPEYNHSFPATLKNAIDYLVHEWSDKPSAIVSYGGVSAGIRAAEHLRAVLQTVANFIVPAAITIPFHFQRIDDEGFHPTEIETSSVALVLDSLMKYHGVLSTLRK